MRVTNKMLANHSLSNLYSNMKRLDKINEQLSSGRKILRPSDDPVGTSEIMKLKSSLREIQQHQANVDRGMGYLESVDSALGELHDVLQRGRELAVNGSNGTLDDDSKTAIADEVSQLMDHAMQVGNSAFAGKYMFGYNKTDQPPFSRDTDGNIRFLGEVLITPDGGIASGWEDITPADSGVEIGVGTTLDFRIGGDDAFGSALSALVRLNSQLQTEGGDVDSVLADFDKASSEVLQWRSEAGAKSKRLEITNNRLDDLVLSTRTLLSKTEDIDVAETIMNLKMEENAYQLALNSGARIIQPTLMDFLR